MAANKEFLAVFLSLSLTLATWPLDGCKKQAHGQSQPAQSQSGQEQAPPTTYAQPSAEQLYQLVAPIALFPDNLVAQVLAASTYPDQITQANNWIQQNKNLKGNALMQDVNQQPWDVSVKGLTQFPDVLSQMASNLAWTSALGDAYFNIPQDVMNAIQVMRARASQAGTLKSNGQQKVNSEPAPPPQPQSAANSQPVIVQAPPQTIVIEPAQPDVVYVPTYNPTVVYGAPVAYYPGYVAPPPPSTGALVATGLISFGLGVAVGAAINNNGCCGWGWNSWGCGWHNSAVIYNRNVYVSNSNAFVNRNNYYNRNVNNINRNNLNANNVNRNNLNNRRNNFNNAGRSNFATPNFGTQHNQRQFQNTRAPTGQQSSGMKSGGGLNQATANQPRFNQGNAADRPNAGQNRAQLNQNRPAPQTNLQNRPNFNEAQRNSAARGFGQQNRGTASGAFSDYGGGGQARVNSARGQRSLGGGGGGFRGGRRR
jgi:hypothetical protein